jgi:TolB-like protein
MIRHRQYNNKKDELLPYHPTTAGNPGRPTRSTTAPLPPAIRLILCAAVAFGAAQLALWAPDLRAADGQAAPAPETPAKAQSIVLAVLPFTASAPDDHFKPLVDAMGDMLAVHLSRHPTLRLVERVDLDKVLKEQALGPLQKPDDQARVGKLLKAQYVIVGGVTVDGKELQINLRAVEVNTARIAGASSVACSSNTVLESLGKIGEKLIHEMDLKLPDLPENRVDKIGRAHV